MRAKPSRLAKWLTRRAMTSGVGQLTTAYLVSRWLTRPARGHPQQTPAESGLAWQPVQCRTADGVLLRGWSIEPAAVRATVALFHGLRQSRSQTLGRAVMLARAGYRAVTFDHRAHGESGGRHTSFGYHERLDVAGVAEWIRRQWPNGPRFALGISMGAAALCYAAGEGSDWNGLILEGLYHDIGSTFASRIGTRYPAWFGPLVPGIVGMTERRLGLRMSALVPAEYVGRLGPVPVLILTGERDPHAPPAHARRLYERCRGPKELWLVPEAGHRDVFEVGGPAYRERVLAFLERWAPRPAA